MSGVLESSGRGVELSFSWLRNDIAPTELKAACRADTFLPVFEPADRRVQQFAPSGHHQAFIGRAMDDNGWRIGTFYWSRRDSSGVETDADLEAADVTQRPLRIATETGSDSVYLYEILCRSHLRSFLGRPHRWVPWFGCDEVPRDAVIGGCIRSKPVFIARAVIEQTIVAGEFQPFRQRAEFVLDGQVRQLREGFDVLTLQERAVHPDTGKVFRF